MKILVTGGAGFIGSHLVQKLALNHQVLVLDNLSHPARPDLPAGAELVRFDLTDQAALKKTLASFQPQAVFHLAAVSDAASTDRDLITRVNIKATEALVKLLKSETQLIFASSAAVYGNKPGLPLKEDSNLNPVSLYGRSKLAAERFIQASSSNYVIFRFANVFGPYQSDGSEGGVISIFFRRSLNHEPLVIFGDGRQTRDFIFVSDIVSALVKSLELEIKTVLNLSSQTPTQIKSLAERIINLTGSGSNLVYRPPRPGDIYHSLIANDRAKKLLSWQPQVSLKNGLKQFYEFLSR